MSEPGRDDIVVRVIGDRDAAPAAVLMEESGRTIAGFRSRASYRSLCRDALVDPRAVVVVAESDGRLVGYGVGFIDWARYRRSYARRHPVHALLMLGDRLLATVRKKERGDLRSPTDLPAPPGVRPAGASGRSWRDSSPKIAKFADIFVIGRSRGRGIGPRLVGALFAELARRGATRVDCRTDIRNAATLRMNEKVGLKMEMTGVNSLFGTRDLGPPDEEIPDDHV